VRGSSSRPSEVPLQPEEDTMRECFFTPIEVSNLLTRE